MYYCYNNYNYYYNDYYYYCVKETCTILSLYPLSLSYEHRHNEQLCVDVFSYVDNAIVIFVQSSQFLLQSYAICFLLLTNTTR